MASTVVIDSSHPRQYRIAVQEPHRSRSSRRRLGVNTVCKLAALMLGLCCLASHSQAADTPPPPSEPPASDTQTHTTLSDPDAVVTETEPKAEDSLWSRLLPLPIFITEPAIGEGIGATLIYFHDQDEVQDPVVETARSLSGSDEKPKPPPVATGIFAAYTNNDTAAVGIGHSNTFLEDRFRLRAAAVEARINSDYYIGDQSIEFQMRGNLLFSDLKTRLGDSEVFFGVSVSYADASNNFRTDLDEIDGISLLDFDFIDAGIAASLIYDSRDNTLMPADGYLLEMTNWQYNENLGGDFDYSTTRLRALWFHEFAERYVLGVRLDGTTAGGRPPFYAYPYVRLRGIPALRYQGETATAAEIEGRYRISDRWSVSIFAGSGWINIGDEQVEPDDTIRTYGIGGRFLALREQDAWVGIDVAQGPEELVYYIQIGTPW